MNFIDDGTIEWKDLFNEFNIFFINDIRISEDYEEVYKWTNTFYKFIYDIIHNKLFARRELEENENEIRNLVKYVINKMLPFINFKIRDMNNILNRSRDERLAKLLLEYYDLEDNLYALASFRSLTHYAHYMERQDDLSQLVWKYNMEDTMGGVFYYSNMMILNKNCKIKNMIKQCPTGYGKCLEENTNVLTDKGYIKIKDIKIGDKVASMKNNELVYRDVLNKWNTNKKQIKIKTRSGREIITSPEHRMYTQRGYVESKDLTINDYFYLNNFKMEQKNKKEIDENEMFFITGMIFEGSCSKNSISFCQEDNELKERFLNCSKKLGFDYGIYLKENNKQWARNKTLKKEKVEEFSKRTGLLKDILYKDFVYDKIISIEFIDEEIPMVDIEVEETHNFVANGFVSHNSKSDCIIISFCFGYDINDDIMKMVGNKSLVGPITTNIVNMMISKRFGKVFPQYAKYNNSKDMFSKCSISSGELALVDSKKSLSFACYNKETAIDGGRFNKQFYDDITQSDDKENVSAHKKDIARHDNQWKKRQYDEFSCIRWYTGTAYHREDLISYVRKYHKANKPLVKDDTTSKFKWNTFIKLNSSGDCVYIDVPKLADLELGEDKCYCTFPQKYSKAEALKQMHSSQTAYRTFMAMEQQTPLPPISLAFDYHYLLQYDRLPPKENIENIIAVIDPNRTGKDNYCCMIFNKYKDDEFYYLVDIYYKKTSPKISIPKICTLMSNKKVMDISFESNTTDSYLFEKEVKTTLINYGWNEFKINSFYSYLKKDEKIAKYQDDIKEKIKFPRQGMYYEDSDMGRAMADIVNYSLDGKNGNDDSIDCCAMLCVKLETKTKNEIKLFDFRI